ncbi:cytochrome-c peroxidase [Yoonia sp. I 8.24]|uniref:cytochrome-c peroxidase n=1 Tax=Yoonia sp. I 8.24 TaxID=1537229 RepID=UPI001EDF92DB|nr:cytochrome c peroxidase [Yoonia sp. I 8.24]MCG3267403.1 cytochrome-c peroxidase [Yoonia sp. I 8.24]
MKYAILIVGFFCAQVARAQELPRPITAADFVAVNMQEARLGQLLFYDPILSGNQEVACATCHHPAFGTSDGLSLGIGDGGRGLGTGRVVDPQNLPEQRIPRNAPALFNLGAYEFTRLFHDGRIEVDATRPGGIRTPLDADMAVGFASLLSAQTMFPVLSGDEMAGHYSENDVASAVRRGVLTGQGGAWDIISRRVAYLPAYADNFIATYDHIESADQIAFTDISNAIAVFMAFEWRSDTAPFDTVLRGDATLPEPAATGMALFYGDAGCVSCHAGPFLTDHDFHPMGSPQIGPGKAARFESHARDEGRFRVTGDAADLYAFRTPSLRNVALTAPYGHAGAYADLRAFVEAHLDPLSALETYELGQARLPAFDVDDLRETSDAIAQVALRAGPPMDDMQITAILAFLDTLTDPAALTGRLGVPDSVPSGLDIPNPD